MNFRYIKREIVDDVVIITFDRPKHNVMNIAMINEINSELQTVLANNSLKCLVFKSEGVSWCAGVEVSDHKPDKVHEMMSTFGKMFRLIHRLEIPTIASVNGLCLGGGMEVAIACDIIVASGNAVFGQPEIKLGFFPPYAVLRLPSLVGHARAVEICTTGRRYTSSEALQMGMISQITGTNEGDLDGKVEDILKEIRDSSPLIIRFNKRAITSNFGIEFDNAFKKIDSLFLDSLMNTKDTLEGISSFEEKRSPLWLNQ